MRLSIKQALAMLDVLKASLSIPGIFGGYPHHIREMLVNTIINQQSDDVMDLLPDDQTSMEWRWEDLEDGEQ
jgi:hypothetical protein